MSSRYLRKLERQRLESQSAEPEDKGHDTSEDEAPASAPKFNAFALLNEGSDNDNDEVEDSVALPEKTQLAEEGVAKNVQIASKSNKKKKKKTKKAAIKVRADSESDSDGEFDRILAEARKKDMEMSQTPELSAQNFDTDDAEDAFDYEEEYDAELGPVPEFDSNFKYFTSSRLAKCIDLLNLKLVKQLDPDHELRNLFGDLLEESIADANATTSLATPPEVLAQFKKLARLTRGWGGPDRRGVPGASRKLLLSRIRDDYLPTAQKPVTMEEISPEKVIDYLDYKEDTADREELEYRVRQERKLGVRWFRYDKITTIQERVANTRFYAAVVMTPDPELLMQLLQTYPYHAETLLQVAMVLLRQGGDKLVSYALVERCLFVFDRSEHKHFHELLQQGKIGLIRLPYESYMLRQFYLCLFRNIIALGERLTWSTAWAYCKFLLALLPAEDPLGVRYFIDHYAMMAQEYSWLAHFAALPLVSTYSRWNTPGIAYSTVLANLKLGQSKRAEAQLATAYAACPYTAICLLKQIGVADADHGYTATAEEKVAAETYLVRASVLWEDDSSRQFLQEHLVRLFRASPPTLVAKPKRSIARSVFDMLGMSSNPQDDDNSETLPYNLIRFAILSGESKIMAKLPQSLFSRDDVFEYDVLPPKSVEEYNVHLGNTGKLLVDTLLPYVDQGLLGTIIQQRTQDTDFDEIIRNLQDVEIAEQGQPAGDEN